MEIINRKATKCIAPELFLPRGIRDQKLRYQKPNSFQSFCQKVRGSSAVSTAAASALG